MSITGPGAVLLLALGASVLPSLILYLAVSRTRVRVLVPVFGPVAAVIAFLVADPDAGCHYDCMGRLAWAVVAVGAAGGWLLGCAIAFGIAQSLRRR